MLKIKDGVDLNIFIEKYGFKPEYNKNTGELIELYRIEGYYLGEREKRRKTATITKEENNSFYSKGRNFKEYWFINPFTRIFKNYKSNANCMVLRDDKTIIVCEDGEILIEEEFLLSLIANNIEIF